jgi:uncharacterized protein
MTLLDAMAILAAGFVAGGMNAVVGAGTLITFPALLAIGLPPVTANVTNTLGLVPGSLAGAYGYRDQLPAIRPILRQITLPALAGGLAGAALVLVLPAKTFSAAVPALLLVAAGLVAIQPYLTTRLTRGHDALEVSERRASPLLLGAVFLVAVYGGYFGAAQGVLLLALFGVLLGGIQAANGVKNVIAAIVNITAAVLFAFLSHPDWAAVPLLAVSSFAGGLVGGRYGRRLPDGLLRWFAVLLAIGVAGKQVLS